jgi:pyruvate dehydrogenase E1 component alpha subunit
VKKGAEKCDAQWYLEAYTRMVRIRDFETKAADCFTKSELAGNIHLYMGEEASGVGTCLALKDTDYITSTHRGHGHCIAKGAKTDKMMAELFGKETGYCKGRGGSMHIVDVQKGILGANGIVAGGIALAAGSAMASQYKGEDSVTVAFFGDAASNQGVFHETVNMAATWKLPIVFLIENNQYGVSTEIHRVTNTDTMAVRAQAYNIPGVTVDGTDVEVVYHAVSEAVARARKGDGPSIVETMVYRYQGHYCGDPAVYRPKEYLAEGKSKDPIDKAKKKMLKMGIKESEIDAIDAKIAQEIEGAYQFAKNSPDPDPAAVIDYMYSSDNERSVLR